MTSGDSNKPLLRVLDGHVPARPPVWLMRQAGRYLPEYRALRATAPSFLDFCYTPKNAAEVTLQPIRRFGFDAAILFSDILVVPDALGQKVSFETGEGPRLDPIATVEDFTRLRETLDMDRLGPVLETIGIVKTALPPETAFIGFCGAPWTVATYMIAGKGTRDQEPTRLFAYRQRPLFERLMALLVEVSAQYLIAQLLGGVDAVQIFDSWAGVLPIGEYERWCVEPIRGIVEKVRAAVPGARIIVFPRGAGAQMLEVARIPGVCAIGLDIPVDPAWAARELPKGMSTQGNLDPLALLAGGELLDAAVDRIVGAMAGRPHIFNLGHGILPPTPLEHVERLVRRVRGG